MDRVTVGMDGSSSRTMDDSHASTSFSLRHMHVRHVTDEWSRVANEMEAEFRAFVLSCVMSDRMRGLASHPWSAMQTERMPTFCTW
jgi:hypothetical protein